MPRRVVRPVQLVMEQVSAGAAAMTLAVAVALVLANTGLAGAYDDLWAARVRLAVGGWDALDGLTLRAWVNDGLMTLFFLVVALELKRERCWGHLKDTRAALLPIVAAAGGMAVPGAIYALFNAGTGSSHGWGIPMATDIVFAVAVVTALGARVPMGARIFLLTLAVVDDLGGIVVIAVFYAHGLSVPWLGIAAATVLIAVLFRRIQVRAIGVYVALGLGCWVALFHSGVHPTIAGVVFGLLAPAQPFHSLGSVRDRALSLLHPEVGSRAGSRAHEDSEDEADLSLALRDLRRLAQEAQSPLARAELRLGPWVTFGVVPLFAFANAGIVLPADWLDQAVSSRITLGVALGLLLGKPAGILLAVLLGHRLGRLPLPRATTWWQLAGVGILAGVGFTVALFLSEIAFANGGLGQAAKTGILLGSSASALLGYLWLRLGPRPEGSLAGSSPASAPETGAAAS